MTSASRAPRMTPSAPPFVAGHRTGRVRGAYTRFVQRLGHTRWFAAAMRSAGARADVLLYRVSGARLSVAGPALFPVLLVTTTGRRSGRPRTTPLIYARGDDDSLIVSSESFGQNRPAAWPLNLAADPHSVVQVGTRKRNYVGRPAEPAEVERYWPALLRAWPAHETYRRRSGVRKVYVLTPDA